MVRKLHLITRCGSTMAAGMAQAAVDRVDHRIGGRVGEHEPRVLGHERGHVERLLGRRGVDDGVRGEAVQGVQAGIRNQRLAGRKPRSGDLDLDHAPGGARPG